MQFEKKSRLDYLWFSISIQRGQIQLELAIVSVCIDAANIMFMKTSDTF